MDMKQLEDIVSVSRENNPRMCVSGVLCYAPGLFLQCLEGPRKAVNEIYRTIMGDPRNKDGILLKYAEIDERVFEEWSMAYVRADQLTESIMLKYGSCRVFDPFSMTGRQALGFVRSLLSEKQKLIDGNRRHEQRLRYHELHWPRTYNEVG